MVFIFLGILVYFLPAINGYTRKHPKRDLILLVDLLLGWSLIGWLIALIWSYSGPNYSKVKIIKCPHCGGDIEASYTTCKHCGKSTEELQPYVPGQ